MFISRLYKSITNYGVQQKIDDSAAQSSCHLCIKNVKNSSKRRDSQIIVVIINTNWSEIILNDDMLTSQLIQLSYT